MGLSKYQPRDSRSHLKLSIVSSKIFLFLSFVLDSFKELKPLSSDHDFWLRKAAMDLDLLQNFKLDFQEADCCFIDRKFFCKELMFDISSFPLLQL